MPEHKKEDIVKFVTNRQTALEKDKQLWEGLLQDVADYVNPVREDIKGIIQSGSKQGIKIYDGTAVSAAVLATDGIHGYHVSPAFPWFKYVMNRLNLNNLPAVKEWLEEVEHNMYMALNRSNFYSEMWPYIFDGETMGTAAIIAEEDIGDGRIIFEAVHFGEIYISENKYGEADVLHRKRKITARQMVQMFGKDNVPEPVKQAFETQPFQQFEILHAVYPRDDYDDRKKDAKNKKYASVWVAKDGSHLLKESGYNQFPYKVWRYMKSGKEVYGRSPALLAMADIKGLNLMSKTLLGAAQLAVDPPMNVPADMMGKVQLKPRGLNYYDDPQKRIYPVSTGINFPVGIDREEAKQKAIRDFFHVDTFLMLSRLAGQGQKTAYEVSELMGEKAAVLGAELGPLNTQLDQILDAVYEIEVNAGRMPQPPDILLEIAQQGDRFDPVYMGPLAQAQRERFGSEGIKKFFAMIGPLVQIKPDVLDNFDLDAAAIHIHDISGAPAKIIRHADERDVIRQGRAAMQQAEAQKQDAERLVQGIKTVTEADKNTEGQLSKNMAAMIGMGGNAA